MSHSPTTADQKTSRPPNLPEAGTAAPQNILVVDDTVANLQLLAGLLKERGYRVRVAPSGTLALQAVHAEPPDLILLDINMPELNGYEVCARLKADPQLAEIPVLFISALNETLDKVKAFGVGGVDYITKPFQFEEVEARVATHLELRRQKRALQESFRRLQELETLRDSLVHLVVHDMRSPLLGINLGLDILDIKTLPPEAVRIVGLMAAATKTIIDMVSSLLDLSKMEAGKLKLRLASADLNQLISEALQPLEPLKQDRQLLVQPLETTDRVLCDADLIKRVVQNFVSNAIKFTPDHGTIRLEAAATPDGVRVSVRDQGPGILPKYHGKIFEKFGQVEMRQERAKHSSGLGLFFSKMAIEAHGGRIGVESEVGQGSAFWFELPRRGPQAGAKAD